jgi:hypothetical protein
MNAGIDYGRGTTNIDNATGIRYGTIDQQTLSPYALDDYEADYGDPTCGKCGGPLVDWDSEKHDAYADPRGCCDYACEGCEIIVDSSDAFDDEPLGHHLSDGEYESHITERLGVWFTKSPYYTTCRFCSPCCPGAGDLNNYCEDGVKAYCPGEDFFDDENPCPYPIFRVDTGECVYTPTKTPEEE